MFEKKINKIYDDWLLENNIKPHHRTHRTRGRDTTLVRGGTTKNITKKTIAGKRTPVVSVRWRAHYDWLSDCGTVARCSWRCVGDWCGCGGVGGERGRRRPPCVEYETALQLLPPTPPVVPRRRPCDGRCTAAVTVVCVYGTYRGYSETDWAKRPNASGGTFSRAANFRKNYCIFNFYFGRML